MKMEKKKKRHIIRLYIRDVITKSLNRIGIKKIFIEGEISGKWMTTKTSNTCSSFSPLKRDLLKEQRETKFNINVKNINFNSIKFSFGLKLANGEERDHR